MQEVVTSTGAAQIIIFRFTDYVNFQLYISQYSGTSQNVSLVMAISNGTRNAVIKVIMLPAYIVQ